MAQRAGVGMGAMALQDDNFFLFHRGAKLSNERSPRKRHLPGISPALQPRMSTHGRGFERPIPFCVAPFAFA
jgi:hypothetical protein